MKDAAIMAKNNFLMGPPAKYYWYKCLRLIWKISIKRNVGKNPQGPIVKIPVMWERLVGVRLKTTTDLSFYLFGESKFICN
jgi:hypothetical protein